MKIFLLLLLSFFTGAISAQTPADSGFTNKAEARNIKINGVKEGKWVEFERVTYEIEDQYFDSARRVEKFKESNYYLLIIYKHGQPVGTAYDYYLGDKLHGVIHYLNGKKNGVVRWYYEDGNLKQEEYSSEDVKNGTFKWYYENGQVKVETLYVNGAKGATKTYDENRKETK